MLPCRRDFECRPEDIFHCRRMAASAQEFGGPAYIRDIGESKSPGVSRQVANRLFTPQQLALVIGQANLIEMRVGRGVIADLMTLDTPLPNEIVSLPIAIHPGHKEDGLQMSFRQLLMQRPPNELRLQVPISLSANIA